MPPRPPEPLGCVTSKNEPPPPPPLPAAHEGVKLYVPAVPLFAGEPPAAPPGTTARLVATLAPPVPPAAIASVFVNPAPPPPPAAPCTPLPPAPPAPNA